MINIVYGPTFCVEINFSGLTSMKCKVHSRGCSHIEVYSMVWNQYLETGFLLQMFQYHNNFGLKCVTLCKEVLIRIVHKHKLTGSLRRGHYRSISLIQCARHITCSSDKIHNNRECLKYGRRYRYTLKIRGHLSFVIYEIEGVGILPKGWWAV